MITKALTNCGPCNDVPTVRVTQIDCATGEPYIPPGADCNNPLFVKSCDPAQEDCEIALAMNPATLEIVIVTLCFTGGVPTTTLTNVDGSPYAGPTPIALDKEWSYQAHVMCAGGLTVTRTDVFADGASSPSYIIWQDEQGVVIPAPGAATYGKCPAAAMRVYTGFERIGSVFTLADALAASPGATRISAYTIKQISGHGSVTGDAGSGVPLDPGETWSGSANSGDNFDELSLNISFDPQGGEMRLMWQYVM